MLSIYSSTSFITFDQQIAEFFNNNFGIESSWNWGNLILCILAILLSVLLSGAIGLEREKRGRSAGLRTHLLVGVGSCLIMVISIYGFPTFGADRDIARLAAQVVAGVGFLGAGAIIHNSNGIKGLTTASTIWIVMAIGLACGSMNFILAIASTIVVIVVLIGFRRIERAVNRSNPMIVLLAKQDTPVLSNILTIAKDMNLNVSDVTSSIVQNGSESCIEMMFKLSEKNGKEVNVDEFRVALEKLGTIKNLEVLNHH